MTTSDQAAEGGHELKPGQMLVFHMVLTGTALEQLGLVIYAWQQALAQGLTKTRSSADLLQVEWLDASETPHRIWSAAQPTIVTHDASLRVPGTPQSHTLQLHFHTPLRLQQQGRPLGPAQIAPRTLVAALARRVALVLEFHAQQSQWGSLVPATVVQAEQLHDERKLRWYDWKRYSSRQQQEMTLGGVLGRWALYGPRTAVEEIWPWLWLGQWLHVGKNASFGLGPVNTSEAHQRRVQS